MKTNESRVARSLRIQNQKIMIQSNEVKYETIRLYRIDVW